MMWKTRLPKRQRFAGWTALGACLIAAIQAALAQSGGNVPERLRRNPDGTLEVIGPAPEPGAPAATPRAPRPVAAPSAPALAQPVMIGTRRFVNLREALLAAKKGDVLELPPIEIRQGAVVAVDGITIRGRPGTHLRQGTVEGKAALVIRGNDVTIEAIRCSEMHVPDRNGACIRAEGRNLTLRNVHFHDCDTGLLSGDQPGTIEIHDSRFENMAGRAFAHGIYVGGGALKVYRSSFVGTQNAGHQFKSRAALNLIEDSTIASLGAHDSRQLDIPHGGILVIRRSVIQKGARSENAELIGYGLEGPRYRENAFTIEDSIIVYDERRATSLPFVIAPGLPAPSSRRNVIVGIDRRSWPGSDDRHFATRAAAGLPPFPELPRRPGN
jgi:hypothetical protein